MKLPESVLLHHVQERHVHGPAISNLLIVGGADPQGFGDVACDFHRGRELLLGGLGPIEGVVAFYDQAQMIGTAPVVNGIATLSTSALAEGNYMVYAVYQGDTNYEPSSTGTIIRWS